MRGRVYVEPDTDAGEFLCCGDRRRRHRGPFGCWHDGEHCHCGSAPVATDEWTATQDRRRAKLPRDARMLGDIALGEDVSIGGPSEINASGSRVEIGDGCDIASFVGINVADSHKRCLGLAGEIERRPIVIGSHVFIGQGAVILGGSVIGDHSVIGAGVVIQGWQIKPWSRVRPAVPIIESGFYERRA